MSNRTTRSRWSAFVRSMCCSITRLSTSRGSAVVASRMSRSTGFSVTSPSIRVQRGVISVIPCTTSTRPPAVESERIRRPNSSNGVVSIAAPMPVTRRPFSGTRWGMRIFSSPKSTGAGSVFTTCRLETMVRVRSSSHIRIGVPADDDCGASGSTATPGSRANRPSSTRPSAISTRSARATAATTASSRQAGQTPARGSRGSQNRFMVCTPPRAPRPPAADRPAL
jgi:hypothetical protein